MYPQFFWNLAQSMLKRSRGRCGNATGGWRPAGVGCITACRVTLMAKLHPSVQKTENGRPDHPKCNSLGRESYSKYILTNTLVMFYNKLYLLLFRRLTMPEFLLIEFKHGSGRGWVGVLAPSLGTARLRDRHLSPVGVLGMGLVVFTQEATVKAGV